MGSFIRRLASRAVFKFSSANSHSTGGFERAFSWQDLGLGLFIVLAGGLLLALAVGLGGLKIGHGLHVTCAFTDTIGLVKDAQVLVAGVPVGRVERLSVQDGRAIALLDIQPDLGLHADLGAQIRSKSLLGEKVVVLTAGSATAPLLRDGQAIKDTRSAVEPDQILAYLAPLLRGVEPAAFATLISETAKALRGSTLQKLAAAVTRLDRLLASGGPQVLRLLDRLERDIPEAERLLDKLNSTATALEQLTKQADAATVKVPGLLDRADLVLAKLDLTLGRADHLVGALDHALAGRSSHMAAQLELTLDKLPDALDRLDRVANRTASFLDRAEPDLNRISNLLNEPTIQRLLREEGIKVHIGPF